jgi:flagellar basal-body rod protein FlgF
MVSGLYAAASAMRALVSTQDTVANNLANVNTPGFKSAQVSYQGTYIDARLDKTMPGKSSSGGGVYLATIGKDMGNGALQTTGSALDVAIDGPGFFAVDGPEGQLLYTRNGRFGLNSQSELVTQAGRRVMNNNGRPIVVEGSNPEIRANGSVWAGGTEVDRLMISEFESPGMLASIGMSLYSAPDTAGAPMSAAEPRLATKSLEMSNVNVIRETIKMVMGMRQYEAAQRAIRMIDDTLNLTVNKVPSL